MNNIKTVLIVEDSASIRQEISMMLQKNGFEARIAGSEIGMMQSMEEYGVLVDLVIMDIRLKYESGFDLINKLKEHEKYCNIPILVLTQYSEREMVLKAKNLGVNAYLRKPFNQAELIDKIHRILRFQEEF